MCYHSQSLTMTQTPQVPPLQLQPGEHQEFQELRVPRNGEPHVGSSPVRLERYDHSPYRSHQREGRDEADQYQDFHHNNGVFALQEKINLLKNHPSEIFNFMVVSGSPRLGKNLKYSA